MILVTDKASAILRINEIESNIDIDHIQEEFKDLSHLPASEQSVGNLNRKAQNAMMPNGAAKEYMEQWDINQSDLVRP
jgi:hypothetical protein